MRFYYVKFYGGAGGHYIQQLLLWCETQSKQVVKYENGHAHQHQHYIRFNIDNIEKSIEHHQLKSTSRYNFLVTAAAAANARQIKIVYDRDPENFRMINTVMENPMELALCEYNHFYKNQIFDPEIDYGLLKHYNALKKSQGIDDPPNPTWPEVSHEDMAQVLILKTLEMWEGNWIVGLKRNEEYRSLNRIIPNTELSISDIMNNRDKVLETVSALVGKPITPAMQTIARRYVDAQKALQEKFPTFRIMMETYDQWNPDKAQNQ